MAKIHFITFGCKVNHYETECMKSLFREASYEITEEMTEVDAVVINSCTVTSSGDSHALAALQKARAALPDAVIALTGCYPQANREEAAKLSEADIIAGTKSRAHIVELVFHICPDLLGVARRAGDAAQSQRFPDQHVHVRTVQDFLILHNRHLGL